MNIRKAKRSLATADHWLVVTCRETKETGYTADCLYDGAEAWHTLLDIAAQHTEVLQTLENIVAAAKEHRANQGDE